MIKIMINLKDFVKGTIVMVLVFCFAWLYLAATYNPA